MITYSVDKLQEAKYVADVFKNSGIKRPYEDIERIKRMIDNSDILVTAWKDDKMVGVARAITDFSYCCYLSDLAVDREYQKHGIGKELIKMVQTEIGEECSLVLLSAPGAVEYYPRMGFDSTDKAFVIKRQK
ncbi:GNAT family N-acetyltransferase [Paenibacillus agricola]|uniref:GNAT family N-acetyltransferase n=1 Tax=Paenibacillus agricola TaxID=2716264 RepID=A0ABX0JKT1_9BACL|nr:GNAT family N-acetyltransferase [Paenibacillus agricola]NHN34545.1 GNAT family N-acetyltransferase [Paenibacillus agricola]